MVKCYKNCGCCGYHEHATPCCPPPPCEHDILCADPVCARPCWDTCKCMDEILKLKASEDKTEVDLSVFEGRLIKTENDIQDLDNRLTGQMGDLAQKEQHDIDCFINSVNEERDRAIAKENQLEDRIAAEENRARSAEGQLASSIAAEQSRATGEEARIENKLNTEINQRKSDAVADAIYVPGEKKIYFKNANGDNIRVMDASDFVRDGMVDTVVWNNRQLIITWNTDSGKQQTVIPGDLIFNPDNYYTKAGVDDRVNALNARIITTNSNLDTTNSNLASLTTKVNNMQANTVNGNKVIDFGETETIATVNGVAITAGIPNFPKVVSNAYVDSGVLYVCYSDDPNNPHPYVLPTGYINRVSTLEEITEQQLTTINNHTTQLGNHTTQLNNHTTQLADHSSQLSNHQTAITNNSTAISNNASAITTNANNIASLQNTVNNLVNNVIPALQNRIAALEADNLWYLDNSTGNVTTKDSKAAAARGFYDTDPNMI